MAMSLNKTRLTPASLDKIGFLYSMRKKSLRKQFNAFYAGLEAAGFTDGITGTVEYGVADDRYNKLRTDADAFARDTQVRVIVAAGGPISAVKALEARTAAGRNVPIVFTTVAYPFNYGLVSNRAAYSNPDRNATGTAGLTTELDVDRLDLLKQLVLPGSKIGLLVNPSRPNEGPQSVALEAAARAKGLTPVRAEAAPEIPVLGKEFDAAFTKLKSEQVDALLVTADPFFNSRRSDVIDLAKQLKRPAIYQWREFAEDGGLMSYGPSLTEAFRTAGEYAGRIAMGADTPATLPIVEPNTRDLKPVINFKTAEKQKIEIPLSLLGRSEIINEKEQETSSFLGALRSIFLRR
jgi:putative ABC transport system substrate-binding protein